MSHDVVKEELALLEQVSTYLSENPYELPPSESEIVEELLRLREEMASAKAEDKASIMQQYDQQFALLNQLRDTRDKPQVDPASPYFAHLRLKEKGKTRDLCLGKATRIDRGIRIVDWRNAPISKIFYSYQEGDEYEENFTGRTLEGEVVARRTVTIRGGELKRIATPDGIFTQNEEAQWNLLETPAPRLAGGQGASRAKLNTVKSGDSATLGSSSRGRRRRRADKHLPDIAGLIDPAQFGLITRPNKGFLVIRGTAGSGKTTVALHRIAYLAYEDERINGPQTLFLVFSKALRDYVGHVLPNLGVPRVKPLTFPEWAKAQVKRHFPTLPKTLRDDTPEVVTRLKTHPVTMMAIEEQRNKVPGASTMEQAIDDWVSVISEYSVIAPMFQQHAPTAFTERELMRATTWCRDRYEEILAWQAKEEDAEKPHLDSEDHALLLRAWQRRVGPLRFKGKRTLRYRHIAVDEVQDFSPIEIRVLLDTLDQNKSITLAGDTQQHVMKEAGFTSWTEFFQWIGVEGTALETLRVAYRSSREIVEFAMEMLGDLREDDTPPLTVRSGPPVEMFRFTDHGAAVAFLADTLKALSAQEPLANVALVAPDHGTADLYTRGLIRSEVPRVRKVVNEEFSFSPGVEVVHIQDVKGLEFDYVIVLEASAEHYPDIPSARRLLHVAATRAIHQLWVTSVATPSPILNGVLEE